MASIYPFYISTYRQTKKLKQVLSPKKQIEDLR